MNDNLSAHIRALIDAAKSTPSQADQKASVLQLAALSQLELDNDFLLYNIAGSLAEPAKAVFGPLTSLLVLTEHRRRQVFFSVLASLVETNQIEAIAGEPTARTALIHHLLTARDKDIVAQCYGACPPGFLSLVRRSGEIALPASFYTGLHDLLSRNPQIASALVEAANRHPILSQDMLNLLQALPPSSTGVRAAIRFGSWCAYKRFHQTYRILTKCDDIRPSDLAQIAAGLPPARVINEIYLSLPFPDPILTAPGFQHIGNVKELCVVANEFSNCLCWDLSHREAALSGASQYYVVRSHRASPAVIRLSRDGCGWYLVEARCRRNEDVPEPVLAEIHEALRRTNIRIDGWRLTDWMAAYISDDDSVFDPISLFQERAA